MINEQSGVAVYRQLADLLRTEITSGRLKPGQPLPSEATLQQRYGFSRQTVRQAVAVLRSEGLAVHVRGRGVLVRDHPQMQDLTPPAGATVTARMPTAAERGEHELGEGVPVLEVTTRTGKTIVYPADQWRLRWPQP